MTSQSLTWRELLPAWGGGRSWPLPAGTPAPLAEFIDAGGNGLATQNSFLIPPEEDDGWTVFYVENQSVCMWAYRSGDAHPDPEVHVRENRPAAAYEAVGCRLSEFLSSAAVIEAVLGAPVHLSGQCPAERLDDLGLVPLELPHLGWPLEAHTRYYRGPEVLAFAHIAGGAAFTFVGSLDLLPVRALHTRLSRTEGWDLLAWGPDELPAQGS